MKARVLIMTGMADPYVPEEQVAAVDSELKAAGAKYEIIRYPDAKHSFTNPDAGTHGIDAMAYNGPAAKASWAAMLKMFRQAFGKAR